MSIADKITQLTNIRAAIRTALQNKGIAAAASHNFSDFAADIAAIATGANLQSKRVSASTSGVTVVTPDSGYDGLSEVRVNMILRQAKTATPGASQQVISPDSGYQGLSQVTVEGDADLVSANIKSGVEIFGVAGSYAPASVNLQSKSVSPSTSAQTVTPDTGYDGLSQVEVAAARLQTLTGSNAITPTTQDQIVTKTSSSYYGLFSVKVLGDANLLAANIKKDISIFGVTGTYEGGGSQPINGSLIEVTCSSNIDEVTAEINGNTYTAYVDTSAQKAYVTIPRTDTIVARTCTLKGFSNGTQVTSSYVSMAIGIGYYTASLSTSQYLYNRGTWYGITNPTWTYSNMNPKDRVVQDLNYINFYKGFQYTTTYELDQRFDMHGYKNFEIQYATTVGDRFRIGSPNGSRVQMWQGSYASIDCFLSTGQTTQGVTDASTNGTVSFNNAQLTVTLTLDDVDADDEGAFSILSIKFV